MTKPAPKRAAPKKAAPKKAGPKKTGPKNKAAAKAPARGRLVVAAVLSLVLVAFLLIGFFPTRTYLAQRSATRKAAQQLKALDAHNAALDRRITRLQTKEEIERIARKEYGLVRPGEESYAILPAPPPPVALPDVWPFVGVAETLNQ